jgi:hypothetical protein
MTGHLDRTNTHPARRIKKDTYEGAAPPYYLPPAARPHRSFVAWSGPGGAYRAELGGRRQGGGQEARQAAGASPGCRTAGGFRPGGSSWPVAGCGRGVCAVTLAGGWAVAEERCEGLVQNPQYQVTTRTMAEGQYILHSDYNSLFTTLSVYFARTLAWPSPPAAPGVNPFSPPPPLPSPSLPSSPAQCRDLGPGPALP